MQWASVSAAMAALLLLAVVLAADGPTGFDQWVFDTTSSWTDAAPFAVEVAAVIGAVTDVVPSTLLAIAATLGLWAWRRPSLALFAGCSAALSALIVEVAKRSVGRMRPPGAGEFTTDGLDRSFPSGHSAASISIFAALALLVVLVGLAYRSHIVQRVGQVLLVLVPLIGLSRIVLGVHWATDVLAGWAIGSAVLLLFASLLRPDNRLLGVDPEADERSVP